MRWLRFDGLTGLAAPMVVWAMHFVVVYSLAGLACEQDVMRQRVAGMEMLWWLFVALGLASLAIIAAIAWRVLPAARRTPAAQETAGAQRPRFVARSVLALCLIAAVAVVYTTLPALLLPSCAER